MRTDILAFGLMICLWSGTILAQEAGLLESLLESYESEELYQTDFLELLQELQAHPINLNRASARELLRIPFLSAEQARAIVRYRKEQQAFQSAEELLRIPGVSQELFEALRPYITLAPRRKAARVEYRTQLSRPLHSIRAFDEQVFSNPYQLYHRVALRKGERWQAGATWEKDSGEQNWFDLGSFYGQYHWKPGKSTFVLGDFNLRAGQGLLFNSAYGQPVSIEAFQQFDRSQWEQRLKRSSDENAFLRGGLWRWQMNTSTQVSATFSRQRLDASLNEDSTLVKSFDRSGYHRTETEKARQNRVEEQLIALGFFREFSSGQAGVQYASIRYNLPLLTRFGAPRQAWDYWSGFYSWQRGALTGQGEAALLANRFPALQQSLLIRSPIAGLRYGVLAYYYHPDYWAYHSRGFGQVGAPAQNRAGYLLSVQVRPFPGAVWAAYFRNNRPARQADEFRFVQRTRQVQWRQKWRDSELTLRYTRRIRKGQAGLSRYPERTRENLRFQIRTQVRRGLRLINRLEISWADSALVSARNYGISFYQDWKYRGPSGLQIQLRWTQFDIPAYDFRIYEFENDLPGNFRNILLNDRGYKWFILLSYRPSEQWRLSFKYREIWFPDQEQLGSGFLTVLGNRKQELRFQLALKY